MGTSHHTRSLTFPVLFIRHGHFSRTRSEGSPKGSRLHGARNEVAKPHQMGGAHKK